MAKSSDTPYVNSEPMPEMGSQSVPNDAGSSPSPSTSQVDFGDGRARGASSEMIAVKDGLSDFPDLVKDQQTFGFTNYASEPTLSTQKTPLNSDMPYRAASNGTAYDLYAGRNMTKERPALVKKGTNILIPFGALEFLASIGDTPLATIPSTVEVAMDQLTGSITSKGNYREVNNWRRIQDLKNTVISYFNRSIPFTDLPAGNRFAIEMCYMRELAHAAMAFRAFDNVIGYYRWLDKHRMQYYAAALAPLYDATTQSKLLMIYNEVKDFPVLDEVLLERITHLGKLHTSCETSGMWGTILFQDVAISGLRSLQVKVTNSGYECDTSVPSIEGTWGFPLTLAAWMDVFTSGQSALIAEVLQQLLSRISNVRRNYSILLGCAMQLKNKGSVKYSNLGQYLPVKGYDSLHLTFECCEPTFDYAYKERVEYSPFLFPVEDGSGANVTVGGCLLQRGAGAVGVSGADPLRVNWSDYAPNARYQRPVGPYHREDAWGLAETVEIGIFKLLAQGVAPAVLNTYFFDPEAEQISLHPSFDGYDAPGANTIDVTGNSFWVDGYFGDVYTPVMYNIPRSLSLALTTHSAIAIYLLNAPNGVYAPNFGLQGETMNVGTSTGALTGAQSIITGVSGTPEQVDTPCFLYMPGGLTGWGSFAIANYVARLINDADLTNAYLTCKRAATVADVLSYIDTEYRQSVWVDYDITLLDNVLYTSSASLAIPMAAKATSEGVR